MGTRFELYKLRHSVEAGHEKALKLSEENIARAQRDLEEAEGWMREARATSIPENEKWALSNLATVVENHRRMLAELLQNREAYLQKIDRLKATPSRLSLRARRLAGR